MVGLYNHHPHNSLLRYTNFDWLSGFVNISDVCSRVSIGLILTVPLETNYLKWCYFKAMCFVHGVNFRLSATLMQLRLSSQTVQKKVGLSSVMGKNYCIYFIKLRNGKTSRISIDSSMYSYSVVISAISVHNFLR